MGEAGSARGERAPWAEWALLFLFALVVRVAVFAELREGPCLEQHRWRQSDMYFYDEWARGIAAGDVLSARIGHPLLEWHTEIADRYCQEFPDDCAGLGDDRAPILWERWYGGVQFHQEPLYPYLIAAVYRAGGGARQVLLGQLVLGALGVVLVWELARRAFGRAVAWTAGLASALSAPLVFHDVVLLRTSLIVFLGLAGAVMLERALRTRSAAARLGLGGVLGLGVLTNSTAMALLAGSLAALAWSERREPRSAASSLLLVLAPVLLLFAAVVARNLAVGAPAGSISSVGALAFICSNAADFSPAQGFANDSAFLPAILHESGNRLWPAIQATCRTHESVAHYLSLFAEKLDWTFRWYEIPNNENLYYYARHSRVLAHLPVTFGLVAPLAIVGAVISVSRRNKAALLVLAGATLLPLLSFYVLSRFRAPFFAALLPFAALACVAAFEALAKRRWLALATLLAGVLLSGSIVGRPLPDGLPLIRKSDWTVPFQTSYLPRIEASQASGDPARVATAIEQALVHEPPFVTPAGRRVRALTPADPPWLFVFAGLHRSLAEALSRLARHEEAARHHAIALQIESRAGG